MRRDIISDNRRLINSVDHWIAEEDYRDSRGHYGCPEHLLPLLDRPIGPNLIYTDLLVYAARQLQEPLNYLEIGVSVGKNFLAMAEALNHSLLVGLDWERFNPALRRRFKPVQESPPVSSFTNGRNMIRYVQGDLFEEATWRHMAGTRFQLIFSDAAHRPEALQHELSMLLRHGLLDPDRLFILWDDLDRDPEGPLSRQFFSICKELSAFASHHETRHFLTRVNGWLGEHEHQHTVGIFNTLGISEERLLALES